ncbi:MAG TPA: Hsp20/alpha crystallin family protein [Planctomycetota bacterium]|nr:Hsp20/alpha crystallin family protein [Planctomycetota bacterium]
MTRALWDPGQGDTLSQLRSAVDRLFENVGGDLPWTSGWEPVAFPVMALREDADTFLLEAELPGIRMNDVEITCLDRHVSIRGERKHSGDPDESYQRRERPTGSFVRTIELPVDVDADRISASLEDGILRISIPKSERAKPRRIEITTPSRGADRSVVKDGKKEVKEE